jgi:hypothetical protein
MFLIPFGWRSRISVSNRDRADRLITAVASRGVRSSAARVKFGRRFLDSVPLSRFRGATLDLAVPCSASFTFPYCSRPLDAPPANPYLERRLLARGECSLRKGHVLSGRDPFSAGRTSCGRQIQLTLSPSSREGNRCRGPSSMVVAYCAVETLRSNDFGLYRRIGVNGLFGRSNSQASC